MKLKNRRFPFEVKEVSEKGQFSGYLSVFHTIDSYKERVLPGAFDDSLADWKQKGRLPPILWQHSVRDPIGPFTKMDPDAKGLWTEGELLIDDIPMARQARVLMMKKVVTGMSIGFETVTEQWHKDQMVLDLVKLNLWEGSIVTFPANIDAQVETVKHMLGEGKMPSVREFEEVLRDVGFSQKQAKIIVGSGYAALQREVDSGVTLTDAKSVLDDVFKQPIIKMSELFP